MIIVQSYGIAVVLCIITMLCWGSWANTQKLASKKWAFQLFYWDYALGVLIFSIILAFTAGSSGDAGRSFFADLVQADFRSFGMALLGGIVFTLANILLVIAIAIAGMAVAFPLGIGLALIIGVIVNYSANPVGNPYLLFGGVVLIIVAIILDAMAYKRRTKGVSRSSAKGIIISIVGGVLMGFFYRFVADSISTNFTSPEPGKFTPYTATVVFAVGLFLSNFIWNTMAMYKPITGERVTYNDYFIQGNSKLHLIGILGGVIWSLGMSLNILASGQAGFAISYGLGQGATLIAALWGVFIWKEFAGTKGVKGLLFLMFLLYLTGLVTIITARIN